MVVGSDAHQDLHSFPTRRSSDLSGLVTFTALLAPRVPPVRLNITFCPAVPVNVHDPFCPGAPIVSVAAELGRARFWIPSTGSPQMWSVSLPVLIPAGSRITL